MRHILDFSYADWLDKVKKNDIPDGSVYDAWRLELKTSEGFSSFSSGSDSLTLAQLAYFYWFGNLAPKTHNVPIDMWKEGKEKNTLELWLDRKQILDQSDKTGRQGAISMGCVCENIEIAAACYGFDSLVRVVASGQECFPFREGEPRNIKAATIVFQKNHSGLDHTWLSAMMTRKTVRSIYDETLSLSRVVVKELQDMLAKRFPMVQLHVITDRNTLFTLAKIQQTAEDAVYNDDAFTYELHKWFDSKKNSRKAYGMRGTEFGMDDTFAKSIHDAFGHVKGESLSPHQIAAFATGSKAMFESSSAAMVITTENDTVEDRFHAGRALEYVVLSLHMKEFNSAIYAAIIEKELDYKLQLANAMLCQILETHAVPQALFRVGKLLSKNDLHRPHSARRSIEESYLKEDIS